MSKSVEELERDMTTMRDAYDGNFKHFSSVLDNIVSQLNEITARSERAAQAISELKAEDTIIRAEFGTIRAESEKNRAEAEVSLQKALNAITWKFLGGIIVASALFAYLMDIKIESIIPGG